MDFKESVENETKEDDIEKPAIVLKFVRNRYLRPFECAACPCSYTQITNLKYHIRREHFNLVSEITKRKKRKINDVWLERVLNSEDVVEIKKTGRNKYVMKKSSNPDCLEIAESKHTVDLTRLYPDYSSVRAKQISCCVCKKKFIKTEYNRHLEEEHGDLIM